MKVINFRINGVEGRAHVIAIQQLKPQLRSQGLLDNVRTFEVDWAGDGNYRVSFAKAEVAICPNCNCHNSLEVSDLGFEEFECGSCESMFTIPQLFEDLDKQNDDIRHGRYDDAPTNTGTYRVMLRGEDGCESCLRNGVPADLIDIVVTGYQAGYTEGQKVWSEPEETYADLIRSAIHDEF